MDYLQFWCVSMQGSSVCLQNGRHSRRRHCGSFCSWAFWASQGFGKVWIMRLGRLTVMTFDGYGSKTVRPIKAQCLTQFEAYKWIQMGNVHRFRGSPNFIQTRRFFPRQFFDVLYAYMRQHSFRSGPTKQELGTVDSKGVLEKNDTVHLYIIDTVGWAFLQPKKINYIIYCVRLCWYDPPKIKKLPAPQ